MARHEIYILKSISMRRTGFIVLIILTACLTISAPTALCQSSFTFKYSTAADEVPFHAVETDDGMYILSSKTGTFEPHFYNTMFFKLNKFGDTIKTLLISKTPDYCILSDLIKSDDGNYLCPGMIISSDEAKVWLVKLSPDLEILMDTNYSIGMVGLDNVFGFLNHENNLIIYGISYQEFPYAHTFIYKMTQSGDSLQFKYLPDDGSEYVYSMIEKYDSSGYYLTIFGKYQINLNSWGQIITIDPNLNVDNISPIPFDLDMYYNMKILNKNQLFITGKTSLTENFTEQRLLGIVRTVRWSNLSGQFFFQI